MTMFLRCLGILVVLSSQSLLYQSLSAAPPNVVILLSDDQAWTDFGFTDHPHIKTPHLDRLASESLTFTRGYVPNSLCRPSLMTLITGKYAHQHGITGNDPPPQDGWKEGQTWNRFANDPDYQQRRRDFISKIDQQNTIAKYLSQKHNYLTFQSGKWWEGNHSRGGFTHGMTHGDLTKGARHGDVGLTIGRRTMKPVIDFIDSALKEEKPFFVWYAPMLPHSPHNPPERLLKKYQELTPHIEIAKYWAMCEWYDESCGEILKHLEDTNSAKNTIVISITDNGWINELHADRYAPRSKRSQYDGGIRTPITIKWPEKVSPKFDTTQLASQIDVFPTIVAAVGQEKFDDLPGINLLSDQAVHQRDAIFGEILEHDVQHMTDPLAGVRYRWVISKNWKLIVPNPQRVGEEVIELFDLTADPFELNNLAEANQPVVKELTKRLNDWWPEAAHLGPASKNDVKDE